MVHVEEVIPVDRFSVQQETVVLRLFGSEGLGKIAELKSAIAVKVEFLDEKVEFLLLRVNAVFLEAVFNIEGGNISSSWLVKGSEEVEKVEVWAEGKVLLGSFDFLVEDDELLDGVDKGVDLVNVEGLLVFYWVLAGTQFELGGEDLVGGKLLG